MPVTPTYPGVYIEEISSGVRTIVGVATSITAFIGRAKSGEVNQAKTINTYGDFERQFGGLWVDSTLGYAVRDFYLNGGGQAIIVRLFRPFFATDADRAIALAAAQSVVDAAATEAAGAATVETVAIAARMAANAVTTEPGSSAANVVATAAETAAAASGATPESVVVAVQAALTSAQSVVDAAATAAGDGAATAETVAIAARTAADAVPTEPGSSAANVIATAAETAATVSGAAPESVVAAVQAALTSAQSVVDAVTTAVTSGATPASVAAAARTAADAVTTEPGSSAANVVATAAETAAAVSGATPASVAAAAAAEIGIAAPLTKARLSVNGLNLEAANEGTWGNRLQARIDHNVIGEESAILFNLTVRDGRTGNVEVHRNVSVQPNHPRNVEQVLRNGSTLVRTRGALPGSRPSDHPNPQPGQDVWGNNTPATNVGVLVTDQSSDGSPLTDNDFIGAGQETNKRGLYALEQADLFNLLCIPPYNLQGNIGTGLIDSAVAYCERKRAFFIIDPPSGWNTKDDAKGVDSLGPKSSYAALFFPRLRQPNPLKDNQMEDFAPCGAIAGIFARTDNQRGVWKAPAGLETTLLGVPDFSVSLTDPENGELNPLGINCLRVFPGTGRVVWGARTMAGDDRLASEWKYIPVRRTALYIEESLFRGLKWVVFEPNDEGLWSQIRLNVGAFMQNLFRQGAFQGKTPREAYLVKCDRETTTQNDINLGIVNIVVGFAPLKPAEFVILKIQQLAGQIEV